MKKIVTITVLSFLFFNLATAQEYKVAMNSGKLILREIDRVNIEGYSGSEIVFSGDFSDRERPERAAGLRPINSLGLEDNSGIGLAVKKSANEVEVTQISNRSKSRYTVKVPKGVSIYYEHSSHNGKDLNIKDVQSEIEVSAHYNRIYLTNVTGPMAIKTVYGEIEAVFSSLNQENSISLYSVYDYVDVTLPENAKANIMMQSPYGEMFTDMNLEIEKENGMRPVGSKKVSGKLNGGGVDLSIKSSYKNVYLRKK